MKRLVKSPLVVTAAVIQRGDQVLIAQRRNGAMAGKWEFPGGKLEPGESPQECLARELREELGVEVEVQNMLQIVYHKYPEGAVLLLVYSALIQNGEPAPLDARELRWVPIPELLSYPLAGADIPIALKLLAQSAVKFSTNQSA